MELQKRNIEFTKENIIYLEMDNSPTKYIFAALNLGCIAVFKEPTKNKNIFFLKLITTRYQRVDNLLYIPRLKTLIA